METQFEDLSVRLIQVRLLPEVEAEEFATFVDRTGLRPDQINPTNVLKDPLDLDLLEGIDAVLIGGAGAYSVTHTYDWTDDLIALVKSICDRRIPLFGSCWGHQFIARALGGTVVHDVSRAEIGCHPVELTTAGQEDELFQGFPKVFMANMGHHDRVDRLPAGAIELAISDVSPVQAFRIGGLPVYGTQFHSELNADTERARLYAYRRYYPSLHDDDDFEAVIATLRETTEVDGLLHLFLTTFATQS
jgi:GMP synthase (glutamine-hydrolysing)